MSFGAFRSTGLAAALAAAAATLASCTKAPEQETYAPPPPPPPAPEQPQLVGAPSPESEAVAAATARQAADDVWLANLPEGLIVTPRTEADGRTVLVISNRPIPNPRWRPHDGWRTRHSHLAGGPAVAAPIEHGRPVSQAATSTVPAPSAPVVTPAPSATTPVASAPVASSSTAAPQPTSRPSAAPAFKGITLSPGLWLALGVLLLIIVLVSILSGNGRKRRRTTAHA